jgi:hypothetical protein
MRSLKDNNGITNVLVNASYPNGAIIDETTNIIGTAVIGEVYNDLLVSAFKIINTVGMPTNGLADNEDNGYQFLIAMQKLINTLVDVEQPLTLGSLIWSVPIAIDFLPNKVALTCKAVGTYNPAATYTFKGTGTLTYGFTSPTGFTDGDELMVILDTTGVKAYSFGGGIPSSGFLTFHAGDLLGTDPFFYLPLTGTAVPITPKYLTMYIKNGDSDNQKKMIQPVAYVADTRIIFGMPSPTDWAAQEITLFFA